MSRSVRNAGRRAGAPPSAAAQSMSTSQGNTSDESSSDAQSLSAGGANEQQSQAEPEYETAAGSRQFPQAKVTAAAGKLASFADLTHDNYLMMQMLVRMLQSNYSVPEDECMVFGPRIYKQLVDNLEVLLKATHWATTKRTSRSGSHGGPAQGERLLLLDQALLRVKGDQFTWIPRKDAAEEWVRPPKLLVFVAACIQAADKHDAASASNEKQHFSLLVLHNAAALGEAAVAGTAAKPGAAVASLLEINLHAAPPGNSCIRQPRVCHPRCSADIVGPDAGFLSVPLLAYLQARINSQAKGPAARRGAPTRAEKLQLLTHPDRGGHPALRVLSAIPPPLPHSCQLAQSGAACLCGAGVLVVLDWLLASWPWLNDGLIRTRMAAGTGAAAIGCVELSSAWFPSSYYLMFAQQMMDMGKIWEQQGQHQSSGEGEAYLTMDEVVHCWQQVLHDRAAASKLCYPTPLGHVTLLEQLVHRRMADSHYIRPNGILGWKQATSVAALLQRLRSALLTEHACPGDGPLCKPLLLPPGFSGASSSSSTSPASSSAAAGAAPNALADLCDAAAEFIFLCSSAAGTHFAPLKQVVLPVQPQDEADRVTQLTAAALAGLVAKQQGKPLAAPEALFLPISSGQDKAGYVLTLGLYGYGYHKLQQQEQQAQQESQAQELPAAAGADSLGITGEARDAAAAAVSPVERAKTNLQVASAAAEATPPPATCTPQPHAAVGPGAKQGVSQASDHTPIGQNMQQLQQQDPSSAKKQQHLRAQQQAESGAVAGDKGAPRKLFGSPDLAGAGNHSSKKRKQQQVGQANHSNANTEQGRKQRAPQQKAQQQQQQLQQQPAQVGPSNKRPRCSAAQLQQQQHTDRQAEIAAAGAAVRKSQGGTAAAGAAASGSPNVALQSSTGALTAGRDADPEPVMQQQLVNSINTMNSQQGPFNDKNEAQPSQLQRVAAEAPDDHQAVPAMQQQQHGSKDREKRKKDHKKSKRHKKEKRRKKDGKKGKKKDGKRDKDKSQRKSEKASKAARLEHQQ